MHISVTFSSPVDLTTLKLKIIKQSDNSALKILSLSGVMNTPTTTRINLETNLIPSTAYTLTVISAVGNDGSVIRDGALALKEFVTSASLQKYEDILNAAPNPNAILVQSGMNPVPSVVTPAPKTTPIPTISPVIKKDPILVVKELPLTGMNPFFLLIIILPLVLFFVRRKRQS